jgi:AcrR family transcriptional regulator
MRESQRPQILEAGIRLVGGSRSATITLEGVAAEAGVTKAGLMYHFPSRDALMLALVEYAALQVGGRIATRLGKSAEASTVRDRYRAYLEVVAQGQNMRAEWALWFQSAYRPELQTAWTRHLEPWLRLPEEMPLSQRAQLIAARLAADGLWAARASGVLAPSGADGAAVAAHLVDLIERTGESE